MQFKPKWHDRIIKSLKDNKNHLTIDIINDMFDEDPDYLFENFIKNCYITTLKDLRRPEDFYMRVATLPQVFHRIYEVMPQSLKQDPIFCRRYLKIVPHAFSYLSQKVKKDSECLQLGIAFDPKSNLNLLDLSQQDHVKILFEVLTTQGNLIEDINQNRYNHITRSILNTLQYEKEAVFCAAMSWSEIFKQNPNDLSLFTENELLKLLEINPYLIYDYPKEIRKNHLRRMIQANPDLVNHADLNDLSNDDFIICILIIQEMKDLSYINQSLMSRIKEDQSGDFFNQIKTRSLLFKDVHLFTRLIDLDTDFLDYIDDEQKKCFEFNRALVLRMPSLFRKIDSALIKDQKFLISVLKAIDLRLLGDFNHDRVQLKLFDLMAMIYDILDIDEKFYAFLADTFKQIEQFAFLVIQKNPSLYTILPSQLKKSSLLVNLLKSKSLVHSFEKKKSCHSQNALIESHIDLNEKIYLHEDIPTLEIQAFSNHSYGHLRLEECLISDSLVNHQSALIKFPYVFSPRHHRYRYSRDLEAVLIDHLSKHLNFSHGGEAPTKLTKTPVFVPSFWISLTPITNHFWQTVLGTKMKSSFHFNQTNTIKEDFFVSCTWLDAIRFCNILSENENLTPYYEIQMANSNDSFQLRCHHQATGYRLPSLCQLEAHLNLLKAQTSKAIPPNEIIKDIPTLYHHIYKDEHNEWTNQTYIHSTADIDQTYLPQSPSDILCKNTQSFVVEKYKIDSHQSFRVVRPKNK